MDHYSVSSRELPTKRVSIEVSTTVLQTMPSIKYDYFVSREPDIERFEMIADVFQKNRESIADIKDEKGAGGNDVLHAVRPGLEEMGFSVERSKKSKDQIPLSAPSDVEKETKYHVDGYHPEWGCVLEVEGGRRDAIYKDLLKGLLLREASTLVLAVPSRYDYGKDTFQSDDRYSLVKREAGAIHNTERFDSPCNFVVIGY